MSEFSKLNGYDIKDKKAVRTYDTLGLMKSDTTIKEGQHIKTRGYYEVNDGGHGEYLIVNDNTLVEDGGSIHELSNGLYAKLIVDVINVKQYGGYGDGIHDDTLAIQTSINSNRKTIYFPEGTYLIKVDTNYAPLTDTTDLSMCGIIINSEKILIGDNAIIKSYHDIEDGEVDLYSMVANDKLEIKDLTFDGQYSTYRFTYGIQLNESNNKISNCNFINFGGSGIVLNGTSTNNINENNINNCKFENCGNSIFCAWVNDSNFSDIQFFNVSEGFDFDKKSSNIIINNILANGYRSDGADACIEINGGTNFTISNVTCKNFIDGIMINGKVIHTENLDLTTISENITISNCVFDTINGYGIVFGNAVETIQECVNITMDNIIVKNSNLDGYHLRGSNIKLINSIAEGCTRRAIFIDTKAQNITIDNFTNNGCYQGLINCTVGETIILSNIYDNETNNTSNMISITGVTNLIIDNLFITNISSFSTSNNRLYYVGATNCKINKLNMPVLDTAIFFVTASTKYTISNSVGKLRDIKIANPTVIITDTIPTTLGNTMAFDTGTIAIVNEGTNVTNIYLCTKGNMDGTSTIYWKKITTESIS